MSYPEPTDVGPAYGGNQRASDRDREQVATLLATAYAEGRLTRDEHDERLRVAWSAQTFDDLVPLTRDLVALDHPPAAGAQSWSQAPAAGGSQGPEMVFTVFGATERKGRWQPRRHLNVMTLFGGTELDLTEATFTDNVCEINVFCLFGGVEVRVPDGALVRNSCVAIFGGAGSRTAPPVPGGPTVVVRGFVGFGGVDVHGPKRKSKHSSQ